jgi:hypothetical protein
MEEEEESVLRVQTRTRAWGKLVAFERHMVIPPYSNQCFFYFIEIIATFSFL